ncbi:uncharacterized protein LOC124500656 isoform X2 [Dermatophagoides farinae]|nr:trafficking kinesin-binding protein 2-like [Dermatophagoides farinae]XP_046908111.1 trafficking kinesin-binding protein 2-like [Dermatophagoides farinae]XP_046920712.1 trafficking kinesin-binding protein 2-like [Dermatophagoides farinae]
MTKVYNDVEALTKLLEEKERDVELAARIGQSLLDQNQNQSERIDELEQELSHAKDKITQLRHDVSSKSELLRFYITKDEEEIDDENDSENDLNYTSISSHHSISQKDASQILDDLERRVNSLEEENSRLKVEKETKVCDLEEEERKELQLINECAHRLSQTNKQIASLQEDVAKRNDENNHLTKEIHSLKKQVQQLEKQIRLLTLEKEELVGALNLAHECQTELTIELIDVKEKHQNLLTAFHEKREECRQLREQQLLSDPMIFSYVDSLAYELENAFQFDENTSKDGLNHPHHQQLCSGNCFTPDSLLSSDSFYSSSPCSSMIAMTSSITAANTNTTQQQSSSNVTDCLMSTTSKQSSATASSFIPTSSSSSSSQPEPSKAGMLPKMTNHHLHHHHYHRNLFLSDKLRYIKPLEGSQILNHWRRLANPNLNDLFGNQDRYVSRIKANLQAKAEINRKCITAAPETSSTNLSPTQMTMRIATTTTTTDACHQIEDNNNVDIIITSSYSNNFVTTNSVFTFTTTSISHIKDSITEVTTTFSDVQPSTGKNEFSFDKHFLTSNEKCPLSCQPSSSVEMNNSTPSTCYENKITQNSLDQLHKKVSLVEQVKNIMKVDQLSSVEPGSKLFSTSITSQKFKEKRPMKKTTTNNKYSSTIIDQSNVDTKVDRISGLNELAKLFALEPQSCANNNKKQSVGIGGGRIITKLQMANNSNAKQKLSASMTTNVSRMSPGEHHQQQQTTNRTNLSVLRNLRKGGLI